MAIKGATKVYLMRHGRTAHNVSDRLRGHNDLALDDTGRAQAEALGVLFSSVSLSRVLSSPLQRARHTAEPTARAAGVEVEPVEGLNDRDYGQWTGCERSEVIARFGSIDAAPGVETWEVLQHRVMAAFHQVVAASAGAIAIVGHDASNSALLGALFPDLVTAKGPIAQANGCWNVLSRNASGHWTLAVLNAMPGDGQLP